MWCHLKGRLKKIRVLFAFYYFYLQCQEISFIYFYYLFYCLRPLLRFNSLGPLGLLGFVSFLYSAILGDRFCTPTLFLVLLPCRFCSGDFCCRAEVSCLGSVLRVSSLWLGYSLCITLIIYLSSIIFLFIHNLLIFWFDLYPFLGVEVAPVVRVSGA